MPRQGWIPFRGWKIGYDLTGMPVYPLYLGDVVNQARKAREFTAGMQFADFVADERTTYAVIRALEIIGEATRRTSADTLGRYPQIPWSRIVGLRNLLIYNYDDVQRVLGNPKGTAACRFTGYGKKPLIVP